MAEQTLIDGRYEIVRELGAGGCGCVYAAIDRRTEKRVAIKLFGHHIQLDRSARQKFELEVKVSGRVESLHIVQVLDAGTDPVRQLPYLVMELLNGKNLQELIEQEGKIGFKLTVEFLRQVASALDSAHAWRDDDGRAAPIVHRDLKPSNLFLTRLESGAPLVKILDWGIAKLLSSSATQSSDLRGTPLYMAPEQIEPARLTPAIDIWNLGLVAFYLLTGEHYWNSARIPDANWIAVAEEVRAGPIVPPSQRIRELAVDRQLPAPFDDWFFRCVNKDPRQRFARAGHAIEALAVALNVPLRVESTSWSRPKEVDLVPTTMGGRRSVDGGIARSPLPAALPAPIHRRRILLWAAGIVCLVSAVALAVARAGEPPVAWLAPASQLPSQPRLPSIPAPIQAAARTGAPSVLIASTSSEGLPIPPASSSRVPRPRPLPVASAPPLPPATVSKASATPPRPALSAPRIPTAPAGSNTPGKDLNWEELNRALQQGDLSEHP